MEALGASEELHDYDLEQVDKNECFRFGPSKLYISRRAVFLPVKIGKKIYTQYSVRTFHKYGFDKNLESHGRGREVSGAWLDTFAGLLVPTGDWGGGAEGFFFGVLGFGHTVTTSQLLNQ